MKRSGWTCDWDYDWLAVDLVSMLRCTANTVYSKLILTRFQWGLVVDILRLKKVPTFKVFVTLSNLNRFSKFFALLESV